VAAVNENVIKENVNKINKENVIYIVYIYIYIVYALQVGSNRKEQMDKQRNQIILQREGNKKN